MFKKATLDNGVRIVCEKIPYVRSVCIGIWVGTGSRNEDIKYSGISHFVEHMFFKGTNTRSAKDIADRIDGIGGQLNAFTGKECTCYYIKILDTHIDIAIDLLSDMFFNSKLSYEDIEVEKKIILEEIGMYEDSPEELVHDLLSEIAWKGNSLSYPILGTGESLKNINRDSLVEYLFGNYVSNNVVISVAGNFDYENLMGLLNKNFGNWNNNKALQGISKAEFVSDVKMKPKDNEQIHICMGFNGIEHGNDDLYSLLTVNNVFGGGMSSHLFQKIREEKGLVYSIYSYPSSYKDCGIFTIYAAMNPEHVDNVIELIMKEIKYLTQNGISLDEFNKSKEQLKGNYILGLESTSSRMNSIGKSELLINKIYTPEEIIEKIDKISMEDTRNIIEKVFNVGKFSFSAVGNVKGDFKPNFSS